MKKRTNGAVGFTLIELLVMIAIIGILASMLLPVLKYARESAKSIDCLNRTKQLGSAALMYVNDYNDYLPDRTLYDPSYSGQAWCAKLAVYLGVKTKALKPS